MLEDEKTSRASAQLNYVSDLVQSVDRKSSKLALLADSNQSHQEETFKLAVETSERVNALMNMCHSIGSEVRPWL